MFNFFLSQYFQEFFSSGSTTGVNINGCGNSSCLVFGLSLVVYFFKSYTGKTGCFISNSLVKMTLTAFFSCILVTMNGPQNDSCSFLGSLRLLKLIVEIETWSPI